MGLINKKKMDIEEEIELLYDNDMERIKRWKKAKLNSIIINIFTWMFIIGFSLYLLYNIFVVDDTENLTTANNFQADSIYFWLWIFLSITLDLRSANNELKFLSTIGVLKRKIKQNRKTFSDKASHRPQS